VEKEKREKKIENRRVKDKFDGLDCALLRLVK
jgi:hypothetical protein